MSTKTTTETKPVTISNPEVFSKQISKINNDLVVIAEKILDRSMLQFSMHWLEQDKVDAMDILTTGVLSGYSKQITPLFAKNVNNQFSQLKSDNNGK
jgi:CO dehydrogenase/acetyl-CoA synthase epsilon subunit